jgi:hypothetical protein
VKPFREIDQQIDESYNKMRKALTKMHDTAQRMHDIVQRQIVASKSSIGASESSTTIEEKMIVPCQPHVIGIQQPMEVVMQSTDPNNKLIVLPESIEVNSILNVTKTPVSKENQMSPVKMQPYSPVLLANIPLIMEQFVEKKNIMEGTIQ